MSDTLTTELDEYVITDFHNNISAKFHGLILLPNGVHSLYAYFYSLITANTLHYSISVVDGP